jgi:hypothetical protein
MRKKQIAGGAEPPWLRASVEPYRMVRSPAQQLRANELR